MITTINEFRNTNDLIVYKPNPNPDIKHQIVTLASIINKQKINNKKNVKISWNDIDSGEYYFKEGNKWYLFNFMFLEKNLDDAYEIFKPFGITIKSYGIESVIFGLF